VFAIGLAIGTVADPRVFYHLVVAAGLMLELGWLMHRA